ncbi:hypothetical protein D3C85_1709790 [compost metagenome]
MASGVPNAKLSSRITSFAPAASKASAVWEPTRLAAPAIRMRESASDSAALFFSVVMLL